MDPALDRGSKYTHLPKNEIRNTTIRCCVWLTTTSLRTYATVVNSTAKRGYRTDLRTAAIARTSAIKSSQRVKKDAPKPKLRGAKAKKAAEEA